MKNIVIHIGTEKTGTSSIQYTLRENKKFLSENNMLYPKGMRYAENHLFLTLFAAPHSPKTLEIKQRLNLTDSKKLEKVLHGKKYNLQHELNNSPYNSFIFSSEHLSSRIDNQNQTNRIKTLFDSILKDYTCKIIVYLRRQDKLISSYYSTSLKVGNIKDFVIRDIIDPWFNYKKMLEPWISTFGLENVSVRIFDKKKLYQQDIVTDFMYNISNGSIRSLNFESEKVNKSLTRSKLAYLRWFNESSKHLCDQYDIPSSFRSNIVKILEEMPSFHFEQDKIELGAISQRYILNRFQDSNTSVANLFFNKDLLFDNTLSRFDLDKRPTISVEEAIFTSIYFMIKKHYKS